MPLPQAPTIPADTVRVATAYARQKPRETAQKAALPIVQQATRLHTPLSETKTAQRASGLKQVETKITPKASIVKVEPKTETKAEPKAQITSQKKPAAVKTKSVKAAQNGPKKLFVLDTNVLMHDPSSLFRFAEHDVYLPMIVLEELDNHKKGVSEVARHARMVSRSLDTLVKTATQTAGSTGLLSGIPLHAAENSVASIQSGDLYFQTQVLTATLPDDLPGQKADNQILSVLRGLTTLPQFAKHQVILVSKDINIRLKAAVLGLAAQDYLNDHVLDDTDSLYTGWTDWVSDSAIEPVKKLKTARVWHENGIAHVTLAGDACAQLLPNGFVNLPTALADDEQFALGGRVTQISHSTKGTQASLVSVRNFMLPKTAIWGVNARNLQQNAALDLLMNPDIDFVSLLGQAGTGKTLLALAAGLAQVMDKRLYSEIILTRATVPVGDDIGFLPGTEEEKMAPWMGAVEDNLEVLLGSNTANGNQSISQSSNGFGSKLGNSSHGAWGASASMDMVRSRIKIKSMAFMRGRTFQAKFVIVDEAQNLTPKQMKTLITRAGPGTKLVCLGNIAQIDTPYLTEASSGISFVVDRMKGWPHGGHMTLLRGERSRLADFASEVL